MKRKRAGKLAVITCFVLITALMVAAPVMAKSKGKLPKNIKYESYNFKTKSWITENQKYDMASFKYNKKGDPVKITVQRVFKNNTKEGLYSSKFNYKYKKKKIKSRTEKDPGNCMESILSYKKGVPYYENTDNDGYKSYHNYKFKGRYLAQDSYKLYDGDGEMSDSDVIKYNVKLKKGYPVKITCKRMIADGPESTVCNFNKKGKAKGLVKTIVRDTPDYKSSYNYKYKFKKGRVSVVTKNYTAIVKSDNSKTKYKERITYKYNKKSINAKRYGSMINGTVAGILRTDYVVGTSDEDFFGTYWF